MNTKTTSDILTAEELYLVEIETAAQLDREELKLEKQQRKVTIMRYHLQLMKDAKSARRSAKSQ